MGSELTVSQKQYIQEEAYEAGNIVDSVNDTANTGDRVPLLFDEFGEFPLDSNFRKRYYENAFYVMEHIHFIGFFSAVFTGKREAED